MRVCWNPLRAPHSPCAGDVAVKLLRVGAQGPKGGGIIARGRRPCLGACVLSSTQLSPLDAEEPPWLFPDDTVRASLGTSRCKDRLLPFNFLISLKKIFFSTFKSTTSQTILFSKLGSFLISNNCLNVAGVKRGKETHGEKEL